MENAPREFIKVRLGGPATAAEKLNMRPRTVEMWAYRKRIPRTAWPDLIAAYPDLTLDELRALEGVD